MFKKLLNISLMSLFAFLLITPCEIQSSEQPSQQTIKKKKLRFKNPFKRKKKPSPYGKENVSPNQNISEEAQMRYEAQKFLPLVQKSFIDPRQSFKVETSEAHQMSPIFLSTYTGKQFLTETGGNAYNRMKGSIKLMILVEAQYRFGARIYLMPDKDRLPFIEQRFYGHLEDAKAALQGQRRIIRKDSRPLSTLTPEERAQKQKAYSLSFTGATNDDLVKVYDRLKRSLIGTFLNKPLIPSQEMFLTPGDSRKYTPNFLRKVKENPSKLRGRNVRNVILMLLLIEDFLKGSQIPKDPKARTQKADQLYIQLVSSMGYEQQQLSESQNNAMVVKIINNIEVITGLKDLYANLAKQQPQQQSSRSKQERKEKRRAGRWEPIRPPQEQQQQSLPRKRPRPRGGVWVPQGIPSRQDQ